MADSEQLIAALDARVQRREDRRAFFMAAVGAAAVGVGAFAVASPAAAQAAVTDADILNFALNLEYLEANFYSYAVFGNAVTDGLTTPFTTANAGKQVTFTDPIVAQYAREIANDEIAHVKFLRTALGTAAVAQPTIDVGYGANNAFSKAAQAAGVVAAGAAFDPYSSDEFFLLGAFIFEDVGVTAYKGASSLLTSKTYLDAAAGILAAEAYHASIVRTVLDQKGVRTPSLMLRENVLKISDARDGLDGTTTSTIAPTLFADDDQGITPMGTPPVSNIVPTDSNAIAFGRTTGQVLNIVYLNKAAVTMGGFFPAGVNGTIKTSAASG